MPKHRISTKEADNACHTIFPNGRKLTYSPQTQQYIDMLHSWFSMGQHAVSDERIQSFTGLSLSLIQSERQAFDALQAKSAVAPPKKVRKSPAKRSFPVRPVKKTSKNGR